MPRFHYRALTGAGELVAGEVDGPDSAAVIASLADQALLPIDAVERQAASANNSFRLPARHSRAIPLRELALFSQQLARLLRAGLPLDRALEILAGLATGRRGVDAVRQV